MRRLSVSAACAAALFLVPLATPPAALGCPECEEYQLHLPPPTKPGGGGGSAGSGSGTEGAGNRDSSTSAPAPAGQATGTPPGATGSPSSGASEAQDRGERGDRDRGEQAAGRGPRDSAPETSEAAVDRVSQPLDYEPLGTGGAVVGELTRGMMPVLLFGLIAIAAAGAWSRRRRDRRASADSS